MQAVRVDNACIVDFFRLSILRVRAEVPGRCRTGNDEVSTVSVIKSATATMSESDRIVFRADRFQFTPGIPARFEAVLPRIEVSIDQRQIDRWLHRAHAPFKLRLVEGAIEFQMDVGGFPITRTETELRVQRGWFVFRPKRAEFLGVRTRLVSLFRTYLPLPRLAAQTRLTGIKHFEGALQLELSFDDFADVITPGLIERLQQRFLPFAK